MINEAKIEVRVTDVDNTLGVFQHLFIIYTNSQGKETLLRGGPGSGGMIAGDIKIIKGDYVRDGVDWDREALRVTIASGIDSEMQFYVDKMWAKGQEINSGNFDYKLPTVGHVQNSNTVVPEMVRSAGLEMKLPLRADGRPLNIPGVDSYFKHTTVDQSLGITKEGLRILGEGIDRATDETFTGVARTP